MAVFFVEQGGRDIKYLVAKGVLVPMQGRARDVLYGIRCGADMVVPMPEDL